MDASLRNLFAVNQVLETSFQAFTDLILVLDESVGVGAAIGLVLILAGSWLSTNGRVRPRVRTVAAA